MHPDESLVAEDPGTRERVLAFRFGDDRYAIRIAEIGGVLGCATIRAVPGSPAHVVGLCEWRGSVFTVLDLAGLLERDSPGDPACLIRLGTPMDQTALYLHATVQLVEHDFDPSADDEAGEVEPRRTSSGEIVYLVRPAKLVRRVEVALRGRV